MRVVDWRWVRENEEVLVFSPSGMGASVAVGSTWRSRDPRQNGRTVEVIGVYPTVGKARIANVVTGRTSTVSLGHFIGNGRHDYEQVQGEG